MAALRRSFRMSGARRCMAWEFEAGLTVTERIRVNATYAYTHAEIRDHISTRRGRFARQ